MPGVAAPILTLFIVPVDELVICTNPSDIVVFPATVNPVNVPSDVKLLLTILSVNEVTGSPSTAPGAPVPNIIAPPTLIDDTLIELAEILPSESISKLGDVNPSPA